MGFHTASADGIERLYHWQRFDEERLRTFLRDRKIYCSDPSTFNDPWDCKPHFNTELLTKPVERERHIEWSIDICRRQTAMSDEDVARLEKQLRADNELLAEKIDELSLEMWPAIASRYRVYCLGPYVDDLLMWSHYAESHKGICLEFDTRNNVMCCPLRVEYYGKFPIVKAYSSNLDDNMRPLLAKADVWQYECEYRLIAQDRGNATADDTLMTDNNLLKLPESALLSIIVGCQGPYDEVLSLVREEAVDLPVRRAQRVPNRFELLIE